MKKGLLLFSLLILIVLQSCDSDFQDLGDGFSFGYVNTPEANNIYYEHIGLINDRKIDEVRWNDQFILVHTIGNKWILIDKMKVIRHESEEESMKYISESFAKKNGLKHSIKI